MEVSKTTSDQEAVEEMSLIGNEIEAFRQEKLKYLRERFKGVIIEDCIIKSKKHNNEEIYNLSIDLSTLRKFTNKNKEIYHE